MPKREITINNLHIKLPDRFKNDAEGIGAEVANSVSDKLPQQLKTQHIDALNLRVNVNHNSIRSQLTGTISDAILKGLK